MRKNTPPRKTKKNAATWGQHERDRRRAQKGFAHAVHQGRVVAEAGAKFRAKKAAAEERRRMLAEASA